MYYYQQPAPLNWKVEFSCYAVYRRTDLLFCPFAMRLVRLLLVEGISYAMMVSCGPDLIFFSLITEGVATLLL